VSAKQAVRERRGVGVVAVAVFRTTAVTRSGADPSGGAAAIRLRKPRSSRVVVESESVVVVVVVVVVAVVVMTACAE